MVQPLTANGQRSMVVESRDPSVERLVVPRRGVLDRFEVREHGHVGDDFAGSPARAARAARDPWWTVHAPGTSTCSDTNRRAPDCRVRRAWYWTPAGRWRSTAVRTASRSSTGRAVSSSPSTDSRTIRPPVQTMLPATSECDDRIETLPPGQRDRSDAATTPADVHTSVSRWWALAASVTDSNRRLAASITRATTRLTSEAVTDTARPTPSC